MQHLSLLVVMLFGAVPDAYPQVSSEAMYGNCSRSTSIAPTVRIRACDELLQHNLLLSGNEELMLREGQAYLDKGDYDRAIRDYGVSIGDAVRNARHPTEAYLHRAVAYALQRKFAEAHADIAEATRLALKSSEDGQLFYRVKIIGTHLLMIRNGVESPLALRDMLETKINITNKN